MKEISEPVRKIKDVLKMLGISYMREKKFKGLVNDNKTNLAMDFAFKANNKYCCIEFNGRHHYFPMGDSERAQKRFERFRFNGNCRKEWAKINRVPLLIIPFDAEDQIEKTVHDFVFDCWKDLSELPYVRRYEKMCCLRLYHHFVSCV